VKSLFKESDRHHQELVTLKAIAETLNRSNNLQHMLQNTLEKLLEVTDLETGWIFLVDDDQSYRHVADHNLPPALCWGNKEPMHTGYCWCLGEYLEGNLNEAVNIMECKRLDDAVTHNWGDTHHLTHHATVPLTTRGESFGLLNVGSPGKEHFSEEELILLESVAYQIGTAVERTRLYEHKKKQEIDEVIRYIVDYYTNIDEVTRLIWKINDLSKLLTTVVEQIGKSFGWPTVAVMLQHRKQLTLRALYNNETVQWVNESLPTTAEQKLSADDPLNAFDIIMQAYNEQKVCQTKESVCHSQGETCHRNEQVSHRSEDRLTFPSLRKNMPPFSIAIPLKIHDEMMGVLLIGRERDAFNTFETEILKILADHISLAMENIRLYKDRQELLLIEERKRLARDLHDSVNQKLFSLSLTARGIKEILKDKNDVVLDGITDIGQLAQEALVDMRSLIWQLRPFGIEKGILASLKEYGEKIGLDITVHMKEEVDFPQKVEEVLWRIGQEALNNVSKHAHTNHASIKIERTADSLRMTIADQGCGFSLAEAGQKLTSLGMTSMKERTLQINAKLDISSKKGEGTTISVTVPASEREENKK
jgi:two-component system, NarL family, sensor kinase